MDDLISEQEDSDWRIAAEYVVQTLIARGDEFSTDNVWAYLDRNGFRTKQRKRLGTIILAASKAGSIEKTGEYIRSERKVCGGRSIAVWQPVQKTSASNSEDRVTNF